MTATMVPPGDVHVDPGPERPWSWHLSRASAIALVVLLPVHLVSWHFGRDGVPLTADDLAERWDTAWRLVDWATLVLAVVHGAIALQPTVPADPTDTTEAVSPLRRRVGVAVLTVAAAAIGCLTYVVFSFGLFF